MAKTKLIFGNLIVLALGALRVSAGESDIIVPDLTQVKFDGLGGM